jgi:hypothetical protein
MAKVWLSGQGFGRNTVRKLVIRKFKRRGMKIEPSEWVKTIKIFESHVNANQSVTSEEEDFNNEFDRILVM